MSDLEKAARMALEALERCVATCFDRYAHEQVMSRPEHFVNQAITALRQALEQPEQSPLDRMAENARTLGLDYEPVQEPVACAVCNEVHAILDADASRIIRNAADGYPEGRASRVLTLQERVAALCVYAADWRRWCLEKENAPQQKPVGYVYSVHGERIKNACIESDVPNGAPLYTRPQPAEWVGLTQQDIDIAFDDTQEGGGFDEFARAIEAKLKEKNA